MSYPTVKLRDIAPPETSRTTLGQHGKVWMLNLDQIEKDTGRILSRQFTDAQEASVSTAEFDTRHVLYSKLRPNLNKVVCPDQPGYATTELVRLVPDQNRVLREYLTFYLRSNYFVDFATQCVAGAKMPRMVMDEFWDHNIPVPETRAEQLRIVEIIAIGDALRHQAGCAVESIESLSVTIFRRAFGDPKANEQAWETVPLTRACSPRQWPTISVKDLTGRGYPVFGANGIIGYHDSYNHEHPTVAITCRGATCGTVNLTPEKCYITGNSMALDSLDAEIVTEEFLFWNLVARGLSDTITGAAQPQITRANLDIVSILKVPKHLRDAFTRQASEIRGIQSRLKDQLLVLETLFQTLLQRAFDGRLTAKWREAHAKELLEEMQLQSRA